MAIDLLIASTNPQSYTDGLSSNLSGTYARASRRGELIVPEWKDELAREGRMFNVSNLARQTAIAAGGLTYSETAPAFSVDIQAGNVAVPSRLLITQGGTVAGGPITWFIAYDTTTRFSSGTAVGPSYNLRTDQPSPSGLTWYANPTLVTKTSSTIATLAGGILVQTVTTNSSSAGTFIDFNTSNNVMPVLVGPACLIIYTFAATTQPSWLFSFTWYEFSKSLVI